ncbi:MAG: hypothetical protein WD972_00035 [Candidatus Andersenbacteria bacterium]
MLQYAYAKELLGMQPGETITPGSKPDDKVAEAPPESKLVSEPKVEPAKPAPLSDATDSAEPENPWRYTADEQRSSGSQYVDLEPVSWSASEFIESEKPTGWYLALAGVSTAATAIIYLMTRDPVTVAVVLLAAVLFAVTAKRKPRTLKYEIDERGIKIGEKSYPYDYFKTFSILEEGAFNSIQLMPLKRFMPPISLYFPPENEEKIVSTLGSYLPHEERSHDVVERLMRRVRF